MDFIHEIITSDDSYIDPVIVKTTKLEIEIDYVDSKLKVFFDKKSLNIEDEDLKYCEKDIFYDHLFLEVLRCYIKSHGLTLNGLKYKLCEEQQYEDGYISFSISDDFIYMFHQELTAAANSLSLWLLTSNANIGKSSL